MSQMQLLTPLVCVYLKISLPHINLKCQLLVVLRQSSWIGLEIVLFERTIALLLYEKTEMETTELK